MALTFTTTDKVSFEHGVKCLVYGKAGVGKTRLCATAPSPVILSAEAGLLSIRHTKIPVILIKTIQDMWDALTWCQMEAKKHGVQSICLDSISEIVEVVLAAELKKTKDPRQAYGQMASQAIDLVKKFRDLPGFHVLITAKETVGTDPLTGVAKAAPTAPGQQVGPALPYLFDEVFYAFSDKDNTGATYYALRTKSAFNADAKDRSGVLDEIEYPDLSHIIGKILA